MRRSRAQIKPNIGPAIAAPSAAEDQKPVSKSDLLPPTRNTFSVDNAGPIIADAPSTSSSNPPNEAIANAISQPIVVSTTHVGALNTEDNEQVFRSPQSKRSESGHILSPRTRLVSTSLHEGSAVASPRNRLLSTSSEFFGIYKKERRKFTGDEQLDPKTMRMIDLISWNPKKERKLDRTKLDNCETRSEMEREDERPAAPQLKLDANGKLVVDETSLVLDERATNSVWQVVEEDRVTRKVNSSSFRRWRKGTPWSEKETEFFYEILRSTGPDFGLMHDFFPRRSRNELKNKFNREERFNWERLNSVMSKPITLDEALYERAESMAYELNKEESEKIEAKMTKKKKNGDKSMVEEEEEWNEETADLEKEAQEIMNELIEVDRRKDELARIKKEEKKKRAEEKRKISKEATAILDHTAKIIKKKRNKEKNEETKASEMTKEEERTVKKRKKTEGKDEGAVNESKGKNEITGYPESDNSEEETLV
ncbi:hypothetical protein PMAYCL1PPCAC_23762 [Pristionchus mayeri]|uniref:Myb-like domain-containing protein n=1 Tax=Pristionchus mayeri TaxID=1317129 RepID=A0AAN5CZX7_9BILA|nr:hypothetical protein PMAYCL1PPCAC_23762 [Pristionchus mayeri]